MFLNLKTSNRRQRSSTFEDFLTLDNIPRKVKLKILCGRKELLVGRVNEGRLETLLKYILPVRIMILGTKYITKQNVMANSVCATTTLITTTATASRVSIHLSSSFNKRRRANKIKSTIYPFCNAIHASFFSFSHAYAFIHPT